MDELVLDQLPDDAGHLVAVEFHDGAFNFNFFHGMISQTKMDGDRIRTTLTAGGASMKRTFDAVVRQIAD
jgi:hypothetical protein